MTHGSCLMKTVSMYFKISGSRYSRQRYRAFDASVCGKIPQAGALLFWVKKKEAFACEIGQKGTEFLHFQAAGKLRLNLENPISEGKWKLLMLK